MEDLARLRQLLSKEPTTNHWWDCVELVCRSGQSEQALLREYLSKHVGDDPLWARCRVPCGDWEHEYPGWELCDIALQSIEVLPEAREIYCPAGTYRMGASPGDDEADDDEKPAREVILTRGLWGLSTPVTQDMYQAVMRENLSEFKGARRPVEYVSWFEAVEFCNGLSKKAGLTEAYRFVEPRNQDEEVEVEWLPESKGYRLPTEAEWEYLCRAGSTSPLYGALDELAWYLENSNGLTHPVGLKKPNAWGFHDTLGNVWEWCMDEWDVAAYSKLPQVNPAYVSQLVNERVIRGGSWNHNAVFARASFRSAYNAGAGYRDSNLGFRVVRTSLL